MLTLTVITMALCGVAALLDARKPSLALYRWLGAYFLCLLPILPISAALGPLRYAIFLVGAVWLAFEEAVARPRSLELLSMSTELRLGALALSTAAMGFLLLTDLDLVPGWTLAWEKDIIDGFAHFARTDESFLDVLSANLEWDLGALNTAQRSLFYGSAAHLLMNSLGYSETMLRLPSVAFSFATLLLLFLMASRAFGSAVGAAAALVFATSESALFYGRYGSSPSGTLLSMLLAYWACLTAIGSRHGLWWKASLSAAAIYVATLQYAVARIQACILVALVPPGILRGPAGRVSKLAGCICFTAVLALVWWFQAKKHAEIWFFNVRGEQISVMLRDPYEHERVLGIPWDHKLYRKDLAPEDRVRFVRTLLTRFTLPELLTHLDPMFDPKAAPLPVQFDPPLVRPYLAPFVVFLIGGLVFSLRRIREWKHAALLAWASAGIVALVFTNRVDGHRLTVVLLPFTLWIAIGGVRAAQRLLEAFVRPGLVWLSAAAIASSTIPYLSLTLRRDPAPSTIHTEILATELELLPGDVTIGLEWPRIREAVWNHEQVGALLLDLLERHRQSPDWEFEMLGVDEVSALLDESPNERLAEALLEKAKHRTLVFAPAERFRGLADYLRSHGADVETHSNEWLPVMIVRNR